MNKHGLVDKQLKVRSITAIAEAAFSYESSIVISITEGFKLKLVHCLIYYNCSDCSQDCKP